MSGLEKTMMAVTNGIYAGCSSKDLENKLNDNNSSIQVECPGGATVLEVGDSCSIFKEGFTCPNAKCQQGKQI